MILLVSNLQPVGKTTFAGLLTNFFSFTSYNVGLICTLVDGACGVNNSLISFGNDAKMFTHIFKGGPSHGNLINRAVGAYLDNNGNLPQFDKNNTHYFKLPCRPFSSFARRGVCTLIKRQAILSVYCMRT